MATAPNKIPAKHNPFKAADALAAFNATINAENSNTITINLQAVDANYKDLAQRCACPFWLSDDTVGDPTSSAPDALAAGTDGKLIEWTSNVSGLAITESDGDLDIQIEKSGGDEWYLNLLLPDGSIQLVGPITFT